MRSSRPPALDAEALAAGSPTAPTNSSRAEHDRPRRAHMAPVPVAKLGRVWPRRQAHETSVHRWDAEHCGGATTAIDPELASDGVDEYFDLVLRQHAGRHSISLPSGSLHLHCTDTLGEWLVASTTPATTSSGPTKGCRRLARTGRGIAPAAVEPRRRPARRTEPGRRQCRARRLARVELTLTPRPRLDVTTWSRERGQQASDHRRVLRQPRDRDRQVRRVPDHRIGGHAGRGRALGGRHREPGLLMLGGTSRRRKATPTHPFGYGRERYFWSFAVALVLFSMGGLFALYEGIEKFRHPHEVESIWVGVAILLVAIVPRGVLAADGGEGGRGTSRRGRQLVEVHPHVEATRAAGGAARGHRRRDRAVPRARPGCSWRTGPATGAGTRSGRSRSACC